MIQVQPSENPPVASRRGVSLWIPAALLGAVSLFWAGTVWHARAASAAIRSLAFVPLADEGGNQAGWLAAGITGGIIDTMSQIPGLQVVAQSSAFAAGKTADTAAIGRQLGVAAVVHGTLVRAEGHLRVQLQMTRAADGYRLWSQSFDQPVEEVVRLPLTIAGAVASRLRVRLDPAGLPRHQPSQEAFYAYLQGRSLLDDDLDKSVERFEHATALDPDFALAWAWLAIAREYRVAAGMARPNMAMPASRDAAERAVALDPECGYAHLALGIVRLQYDWDWAGAKGELDRALRTLPGSAAAVRWRARWLETRGQFEESIAEMQHALALDPLSAPVLDELASLYSNAGQAERAISFAQKALDAQPDAAGPRIRLAEALLFGGQAEKSKEVVQALRTPAALAYFKAVHGDPAAARQILDEAEDLPDDQLLLAVEYARLAASIRDWDRMFSWMAEATGERDFELPCFRFHPLIPKQDPRYAEFLAQMNLAGPSGGAGSTQ